MSTTVLRARLFILLLLAQLPNCLSARAAELPPHCEPYSLLNQQVEDDFSFWEQQSPPGISEATMRETVGRVRARSGNPRASIPTMTIHIVQSPTPT